MLDEKAPEDTLHAATGKRKATATPGPHESLDRGRRLAAPKFTALDDDDDDDDDIEQSPLQSKAPVAESTPLAMRLQHKTSESLPGPSNLPKRQLYSPLPPSSPPSASSDDLEYENAPPARLQAPLTPPPEPSDAGDEHFEEHENKENEFNEDDENHVLPVHTRDSAELALDKESSEDDPFGFTALERRLKSQREARHHSFELLPEAQPLRRGKEPIRSRAPLGELSFEGSVSTTTLKDRHPTPYHESDDLESMYLDPAELSVPVPDDEEDENAGMSPPTGLEYLEAEMDEEEQAELAREEQNHKGKEKEKAKQQSESSADEHDPLRTPRPHHVANIYPLRSPFSSVEGTPCDRSLPDSPLSSTSPMKSMAVFHTLPVSSTRKGMLSPVKAGPRPLVELPPSKRRRITLGKENSLVFDSEKSEDPSLAVKEGGNLASTPKRAVIRRSTRSSTVTKTIVSTEFRSSSIAQSSPVKRGRGRPPKKAKGSALDSIPKIQATSEHESPENSPVVARKRRATASKESTMKKSKAQAPSSSRAAPTPRRGRPPNSARAAKKPVSKGKGKAKSQPSGFEDEDEVL